MTAAHIPAESEPCGRCGRPHPWQPQRGYLAGDGHPWTPAAPQPAPGLVEARNARYTLVSGLDLVAGVAWCRECATGALVDVRAHDAWHEREAGE